MANNFDASFPEIWAKEQQEIFYKVNVWVKIAGMIQEPGIKRWDTFNRPYRSEDNEVQTYTRGTAITIDDKTDTQEQLLINREFATGYYVDDFDAIQSNYDIAANYGRDDWVYLSNQVDADILWTYADAASTVDASDVGWTAGEGIDLTSSNVLSTVSAVRKKLKKQNIMDDGNFFWVLSPEFEEQLINYSAGRDTEMWDRSNNNWFIRNFYNFELYGSNQLAWSVVLALATNPTNGDTVVIAGQTFTFVSSIGTTAGNVLIGWDADTTRANLVNLINDPATTSANQVALTGQNLRKFQNKASATNDNTANTATIVVKWVWVLEVSETLTDATDEFTAAKQIQHNVFGRKWGISVVMQSDARMRVRPVQDKLWANMLNGVLYWVKMFRDGWKETVDVQIKSSDF